MACICPRVSGVSDDAQTPAESSGPELDREQRRLERLRLVNELWPPRDRFDDPDPPPQEAA
jgi:hypothetical protein